MILDCQKCGACCVNEFVPLLPGDNIPFHMVGIGKAHPSLAGDALIQFREKANEVRCIKQSNNRCVALKGKVGEQVQCTIYKQRPRMCAVFEKGSSHCLQTRANQYLT